ncbi:hypothetical protein BABINDRAFT_163867 [Babjeviella inositovora NRRL Y-12698]|uniref:Alpha/beta hydrolase fold-3 domain-containing protein n=1 Tax=Babjeviella inositovora NRRL Y-12698 TaxID=984486 RepID=A0A1E3QHN0_9ASCO|nr:uncharacterized protein BABINDRAFT_163867 [Babjeviella inositovora NRRL Y-12698]ODQ77140.1 hypothetical protein BABINDRAFT_163867 [Babjeviella inositovora NRRL Y-12698]
MLSLKFIASCLLLFPKIVQQLAFHFTVGSNIRCLDVRTLLRCVLVNHALNYAKPYDLFLASERWNTLPNTLAKAKKAIEHERGYRPLPNYGKPYLNNGLGHATWIVEAPDRKPSDPIIFYLHGGGFFFPTFDSQVKALTYIYRGLLNDRLSILLVDYSITPEAKYPVALNQTAYIYNQLAVKEGNTNITILGDSAGGNLAIVLMKHIKTPIEAIITTIPPEYKPQAAILVSPATCLVPKLKGSFVTNAKSDILSFNTLVLVAKMYHPDEKLRKTLPLSPLYSEPSDWDGVFPEKLLVIAGEKEVPIDDILAFTRVAKIKESDVSIEPNGWHDEFMFYTHNYHFYAKTWSYHKICEFLRKT